MKFADNYPIDLTRLLETRMLIQANSGGGKSHALRLLLEQTHPHVQQLIIDPEGEFATLREKFDYIIAAPQGGDALATPQTAALLARRLHEAGVSAVLDIYDLKAPDRQLFVKRFIEALMALPRAQWHPLLLVVDEIQIFCPQTGKAEAAAAVIDVATRGRKRGLCLVGAGLRLSNINKDCAAELKNKLLGSAGLDVDVQRAAEELGMPKRDAMSALRNLDPGEFYAFGPALSREVTKIKVGSVVTTHPKLGQRLLQAPPATSPRLRAQLAKLVDLQIEAEHEAQTIEELQALNEDLRRKFAAAEKRAVAAGVPESEVKRRIAAAIEETRRNMPAPAPLDSGTSRKALERIAKIVAEALASETGHNQQKISVDSVRSRPVTAPRPTAAPAAPVADGLTGPEQRILDAIAWLESIGVESPEQPAVAFLAGYTANGGAYNNPRGRLNARALVEYRPGKCIALTDAGRALANTPSAPCSNADLHERVLQRLGGPEQRLLRPLLDAYPTPMTSADLAGAAGYTAGAGAFNNPRGRLKSLGLIEYRPAGFVVARSLLFPLGQIHE